MEKLEKASFLVVDDEENIRETLSDILQEKGHRTQTAKTGLEALQKAGRRFFNIALIDVQLPDMTGIDVLREFRKRYPSRMNIIITARATLKSAMDAVNVGADAYILKPIDFRSLDRAIGQCLKKQQKVLKTTEERVAGLMEETCDTQPASETKSE